MSQQLHAKAPISLVAKKLGVDLMGVAPVDRFKHAPPNHKPTDIMAKAQSVIVLAVKCLNGPMRTPHWTSYTAVHEGNGSRLDHAAYFLAGFIEENYQAEAIPVPAYSPYFDWDESRQYAAGDLSHKHAAVAAGIGIIGKNSLLITPRYGSKVNLVSIITELAIEADDPLPEGRELCPVGCRRCIEACPAEAISTDNTIIQAKCKHYCWGKLPKGFSVLRCWECRRVCPANNVLPPEAAI